MQNKMRFLPVILTAIALPVFAAETEHDASAEPIKESSGLVVSGTVGLVSNYVSTGNTLSDDNPSLRLFVRGTYDWFFAEIAMNTLQSQFFKDFQAEWIPAVGVTHSVGPVNLYATYRLYRYTGGTLFTGDPASSWNIDELAVGGDWNGFYGELAWTARTKGDSKNTLLQLGYAHSFGKLTLDGQANFWYYDKASTARFNNFQLKASYDIGRGFSPYVGASFGGRTVDHESVDNKFFVGVQYSF